MELRARLLEARGEGDKALDLLREYVNRRGARPEEVLMLVSSLGRQKRFGEALDLCEKEKIWEKCPPQMAGGFCVGLLHGMTNHDEKRGRVEAWLKDAIAKNPKLVVLKMQLADLYDLSGDYVGAQKQYREVLKDEPANVVALNNLAWLLSDKTGQGNEALEVRRGGRQRHGPVRRPVGHARLGAIESRQQRGRPGRLHGGQQ